MRGQLHTPAGFVDDFVCLGDRRGGAYQPIRARSNQPKSNQGDEKTSKSCFLSAPPRRPLRLCGECSSNKTHRRDAEGAAGAQRSASCDEAFVKLKRQNPADLSATRKRQAGDGIFSEKSIPTAA